MRAAKARPIRDAKGLTTRLVPITMSRSASGKSCSACWKNASGRLSPKNTISGLTRPPHFGHLHGLSSSTAFRKASRDTSLRHLMQRAVSKLPAVRLTAVMCIGHVVFAMTWSA